MKSIDKGFASRFGGQLPPIASAPAKPAGARSPGDPRGAVKRALDRKDQEPEAHQIVGRLTDETTQGPVRGAAYEVLAANGSVVARGQTDWQGGFVHPVPKGRYRIRVTDGVRPDLHEVFAVIADTTGRPVPDVAWEILADERVIGSGKTDATGVIRKTVAQGRYRVRVYSDPEKRPRKARLPIRLSFSSLDEAKAWITKNQVEVEIDGKPAPCGVTAVNAGRIVVDFRVLPGEHEVVVSTLCEAAAGRKPLRMVYLAQKITVEPGADGDDA